MTDRHPALLGLIVSTTLASACAPPPREGPAASRCVVEPVTTEARGEYQFQGVSRDGEWLTYGWTEGEDPEGNEIRGSERLNLSTGDRAPLPEAINNGATPSPDGARLVGARYTDERTEIFEHDLENGAIEDIAPDPGWDFLASYSPDGRTILFNSSRSGNSELYLYERSEGTLRKLTENEAYDAHGEFSPDGNKVLFHRMAEERQGGGYDFDLYAYDLATGEETRLTSSPFEESYGSWAPDGETFVFSSDFEERPEQHNLYVMEPDGTRTRLTDGDWKDSYAYWTRDGRYVYFNSERNGNSDIFRIPMDGTRCRVTAAH